MSDYVVITQASLTGFLNHIKTCVGSSVTIGILGFAIIFGITVLLAIIRNFTRS